MLLDVDRTTRDANNRWEDRLSMRQAKSQATLKLYNKGSTAVDGMRLFRRGTLHGRE